MTDIDQKVLIYGYGNPGRQDDALANEVVERITSWAEENGLNHIQADSNYQLNVEDAELISHYDLVIFVDASLEPIEDILFTKVKPSGATIEFTMHAVSCAYVLDLCGKMYNSFPKTYLLHIKGYEWEFMEEMSSKALQNLEKAVEFLQTNLLDLNGLEGKID